VVRNIYETELYYLLTVHNEKNAIISTETQYDEDSVTESNSSAMQLDVRTQNVRFVTQWSQKKNPHRITVTDEMLLFPKHQLPDNSDLTHVTGEPNCRVQCSCSVPDANRKQEAVLSQSIVAVIRWESATKKLSDTQ
jgi:hypothetical protein